MSRSYRKPVASDKYGTGTKPFFKQKANKCVRKAEVIADGKAYKRFYSSYNICDYRFYCWANTSENLKWRVKLSRK